jgi:hypothetical protein
MYLIEGKDVWHKIIQQTGRQSPSTDPERVLPASAGSAGREGLSRSITKSGQSGTLAGNVPSAGTHLTGQTYKNNPFCKIPLTDADRQQIANHLYATVQKNDQNCLYCRV